MMADVIETPKVRCDNCSLIAEKILTSTRDKTYRMPESWGRIHVHDPYSGRYPAHIKMADVCPVCLRGVHKAAMEALKIARGE